MNGWPWSRARDRSWWKSSRWREADDRRSRTNKYSWPNRWWSRSSRNAWNNKVCSVIEQQSLCFIKQYLYHFKFWVPSGYVHLHIFGFWSNLYFLICVCFDLFWRKGWWISIFDVITEMAKRAAEFKIQKRAERQKMKETTRKIKEIRGSDTPEPPSTSTDWQSQMYCLPNNILSCDPNASGQISQKWPVVCFKCLP